MELITLEKKLQYRFKDIELLKLSLIHKSSSNSKNNERLKFLGDSILNSVISKYLFSKFPNEKEGLLTRMRSSLVMGDALTKKAQNLELNKFIILSKGTANLSESRKYSILEGTIESVIGAVFLDSDWDTVSDFILNLFAAELIKIGINQEYRDSKTELQELLQSKKLKLPKYDTKESKNGFICKIELAEGSFFASGNSKRQAEIAAAKNALEQIKHTNA